MENPSRSGTSALRNPEKKALMIVRASALPSGVVLGGHTGGNARCEGGGAVESLRLRFAASRGVLFGVR